MAIASQEGPIRLVVLWGDRLLGQAGLQVVETLFRCFRDILGFLVGEYKENQEYSKSDRQSLICGSPSVLFCNNTGRNRNQIAPRTYGGEVYTICRGSLVQEEEILDLQLWELSD